MNTIASCKNCGYPIEYTEPGLWVHPVGRDSYVACDNPTSQGGRMRTARYDKNKVAEPIKTSSTPDLPTEWNPLIRCDRCGSTKAPLSQRDAGWTALGEYLYEMVCVSCDFLADELAEHDILRIEKSVDTPITSE